MVLVQKFPFSNFFYLGKCLLLYSRAKKRLSRPEKPEVEIFPKKLIHGFGSKSWKIDIFPNGLTNGFGPKMGLSPTFFFGNIA